MEKERLNPIPTYLLSLSGLLFCCFFGLGIIPSGVAYYQAHKKCTEADLNPDNYDNINSMKTAKIVALIAVSLNGLFLGRVLFSLLSGDFDGFYETFMESFNKGYQGI